MKSAYPSFDTEQSDLCRKSQVKDEINVPIALSAFREKKYAPAGDRTLDLRFTRPTPYHLATEARQTLRENYKYSKLMFSV